MRKVTGDIVWIDVNGVLLEGQGESLWLMQDITAMKQYQEQVEPIAFHGALTHLPNRVQLLDRVELQQVDLFPPGRAPLVVCNPPWVPARANSPIEHAVYDEGSRMLKGFLAGFPAHLEPGGEGWLILSDLAEHLGLRPREQLLAWIAEAGLVVRGRHDVKPVHAKAADAQDALHAARAAEVTSLWRLAAA